MKSGKLKKYLAVLALSGALAAGSVMPALAAETETASAAETTEADAGTEASETADTEADAAATENVSEEIEEEETTAAATTQEDAFKQSASMLIQQITSLSDEQITAYIAQGDEFLSAALTSWQSAKESTGAFVSVGEQTVEMDDEGITVVSEVTCEDASMTVTLYGDLQTNAYTSMSFDVNYSLAQQMGQAAMNTVIGLVVVFAVLFFLSYVIGLLKHVNGLEKKEEAEETETPEIVPAPVQELPVQEELVGDQELVAVIAAAIAAYEGSASTEGFVVRSIRKSKNNRWRRA
ncbi:MAG TPA: OadG family protein [Candidatus Limivivens intestinipullorum]|uniref:OadG family protein n=1 Tax=Candidatus Limivivens intestinipullorum TaxID=2840858 RepID=A0A9D1JLE9_9FIRM|nr:OadG family protein [Candidatus Limivivens intestinipullorum]